MSTKKIAPAAIVTFKTPDDFAGAAGVGFETPGPGLTATGVTSAVASGTAASCSFVAVVEGGPGADSEAEEGPVEEVLAATSAAAPHLLQKFVSPKSGVPHLVQNRRAGLSPLVSLLRAPHFVQNTPDSDNSAPHCLHEPFTSFLPFDYSFQAVSAFTANVLAQAIFNILRNYLRFIDIPKDALPSLRRETNTSGPAPRPLSSA